MEKGTNNIQEERNERMLHFEKKRGEKRKRRV